MAKIQFSQSLIKYLPVYLGTTLAEIVKDKQIPFSRVYCYKIADGTAPVSDTVNDVFNAYWNNMGLTVDDLNKLYALIDLIESANKEYKLKQLRKEVK